MKNDNAVIWVIAGVLIFFFVFGGFGTMGFNGCGIGGMMNWMFGAGFGFMWLFGMMLWILVMVALVLFIMWLVRQLQSPGRNKKW
ncbi:hypothetical protein J4462_04690 [Candidatus Pacearchaeota archaeon]|nr:hypothetical protein [Candidatus Pacearchaeota archaeon]